MQPHRNLSLRIGQTDGEFLRKQAIPKDKFADGVEEIFHCRHYNIELPESGQPGRR